MYIYIYAHTISTECLIVNTTSCDGQKAPDLAIRGHVQQVDNPSAVLSHQGSHIHGAHVLAFIASIPPSTNNSERFPWPSPAASTGLTTRGSSLCMINSTSLRDRERTLNRYVPLMYARSLLSKPSNVKSISVVESMRTLSGLPVLPENQDQHASWWQNQPRRSRCHDADS